MPVISSSHDQTLSTSLGKAFSENPDCIQLFDILYQNMRLGHVCLSLASLDDKLKLHLLSILQNVPHELLATHESELSKPIYFINDHLYFHKFFRIETRFVDNLIRYIHSFSQPCKQDFVSNEDLQQLAVEKAQLPGLFILTGGPGTGKTYTAKKIVEKVLERSPYPKKSLILAAPTTKALEQLKTSLGHFDSETLVVADTLHKLVELKTKKPTYLNASCILIDEASMIDAELMAKLFASVGSQAKIIFLGDPYQLPPVGSGAFFQNLIEIAKFSPYMNHVHLEKIYRNHDADLHRLALILKQGSFEELSQFLKNKHAHINLIETSLHIPDDQFFYTLSHFFKKDELYTDHLDLSKIGASKSIILSTLRKGKRGVDYINQYLSDLFSHKEKQKRYFLEPIIFTKTIKELRISNGEVAVKVWDRLNHVSYIVIKNKVHDHIPMSCYCSAFAVSVHKSQGSEYERVFFLLPKGSENFSREIIYTAVTRVKTNLFLWMDLESLELAFTNPSLRYSNATQRFQALLYQTKHHPYL